VVVVVVEADHSAVKSRGGKRIPTDRITLFPVPVAHGAGGVSQIGESRFRIADETG
jgi:hypothetical protein